jgi:hypothetical protein
MLLSATSWKGHPDADLQTVKTKHMLLSATSRKGQPDADLLPVSKHRACSCQQQAERASQIVAYILFKTQSMLLSTTSRKGQPDADLQTVQNPEHTPVSNKQEESARC